MDERGLRVLIALATMLFAAGCGGDRHLPSSNPPEYDPKQVYARPPTPPSSSSTSSKPTQSTEFERLKAQLESLEPDQKAKGEGKKIPFDQNSLQLFKGVTTPCEALKRLVPRLGGAQLFTGTEGAALKKTLGPDAEDIVYRMDEHVAESLKRSLGPGAADCPISVRPRKNNRFIDQSQPPRLVLAHTTPDQPLLLAQTTVPETSQDDYNVQKSSSRENAPPDWVGYKSMETMQRIGKEGRPTQGIREDYMMIIAPKAKRCPDSEGWVEGTFEWFITLYRATPDQGVLYRRHVVAELKGKVDDDAKVQYVDFDARITLQHIGTQLTLYSHTYGSRGRFTIDQQMMGVPQEFRTLTVSDFSAGEAEAIDANLVANLTLIVAYFSGLTYFEAQTEWNKPNTCVEITFTPATKTKKFVPSESTPVKTELRTKKEQAIVPAKFKEAKERPREGNGRVSPREDKSELNRPATFTYQAPATRVQHSGFWVGAKSRAGVADAKEGEWELAPAAYVLEFKSHIVQPPINLPNPPFGLMMSLGGFDAHVQATVPLRRRDDGQWVGDGMMHYATRTTTQPASCEIRTQGTGTTTFHVKGGSISSDPEPFAVNLIILPGQSGEVTETHCRSGTIAPKMKELFASQGVQDGGEAHSVTEATGWTGAFSFTRRSTFDRVRQGYKIEGWTPVRDSDVIAQKTMTVNCTVVELLPCQEETALTLKMADEPNATASPPR